MALYSILNRSMCCRGLRTVGTSLCKRYMDNSFQPKTITYEVDSLDDFTSQLIQSKVIKWNAKKSAQKIVNESDISVTNEINSNHDIRLLSIEKINSLFQESIVVGDNATVLDLIRQCIEYRKCPTLSNLIYVLTLCGQTGDKNTIILIQKLCEEVYPDVLKANSHFQHYLAEAVYIKGNISESLKLFKEVYKENAFLRRRIRLIFKYLIVDIVSKRSEAALVSVVKFSEELLADYRDFFPLICIWQSCFLSEWFTDQSLALELLEKHDGLCKAVISMIPHVVAVSLNNNRTEVVYRLLEMLLKYEMKLQYIGVLLALLDYQIRQGDLRSCIEIIQWSMKNDVKLPTIHHEKFINLILNNEQVPKGNSGVPKREKVQTNFKF